MTFIYRNILACYFMPIHYSFGFLDIFLEGGLETPGLVIILIADGASVIIGIS